ncbi:uncharacterized protein CEXT_420181 [Caerostris extrusa]|uniref:Uncharacterized protein n=1 Tax=Caerostris extrusa TaxID=172846 RepID=A0AAV4TLE7_CAEEX|nr:uncharacterized protein CEXT_420181 [Caerostris extrusa]
MPDCRSLSRTSAVVDSPWEDDSVHDDEGAKDCYEARLIVRGVDGSDSRKYTLNVENERGSEAFAVALEVRGPRNVPATTNLKEEKVLVLVFYPVLSTAVPE